MLNRRVFLVATGAFAAGKLAAPQPSFAVASAAGAPAARASAPLGQSPDTTYFAWETIAEGVRVAWGGGGASLVVSSAGESLLIDCKGYGLGATLRREAEAGGSRLVAAVNTHHHSAQTGGNVGFTADVPLIAHRRAGPRIVSAVEGVLEALKQDTEGRLIAQRRQQIFEGAHSDAGARAALADFDAHVAGVDRLVAGNFGPTVVFDDAHSVTVGELQVELRHFGRAHTDNDIVAWIPQRNVMHVGNLVYIDAHPLVDAPRGGTLRGWQSALRRAHELSGPEAVIVLSDGGLLAAAHDFDAQGEYFDAIFSLAQAAFDAGMTRQQTVDFIPNTRMGRFANLAEPGRLPVNLGVAYDEIGRER